MTLIERLGASVVLAVRSPYHPSGDLARNRKRPGLDHLWIISGTNIIAVAAPEI